MNWSKNIDLVTYNDAWLTWHKHFKLKINQKLSFSKFFKLSLKAKYFDMDINEYLKLNPENSGLHRLYAKNVADAYKDMPRGSADIDSVNYHMTTNDCISPIVLLRITDNSNNMRLLKLDGVHRLVAANFRHSKIRVCIIDATKL